MFRSQYLDAIAEQYGVVALPLGRINVFSLQTIFQPLKMRRDALAAEDLTYEERRALLDEPTRGEDDPRRAWSEHKEQKNYEQRQKAPPPITARNSQEALDKSPDGRMVVLGSPGSGKTTMLKELLGNTTQHARTSLTSLIPIFISLPELAESAPEQTLQRYLPLMVGHLGIDESYAQDLWKAIQQGYAFICLDGLDEVASGQRGKLIDMINSLASSTGNVWIIGSRFSDYKSGQLKRGRFTEWELQPMTDELRRSLAERLLPKIYQQLHGPKTFPQRMPSSFLQAIERHPRASTWGKNPLLFSLAATVFVATGALPSSRAALYQEVINAVLKTRLKDSMQQAKISIVASLLALELYQQKKRLFTREMLLRLLTDIRQRQGENWHTETVARDLIDSGLVEVVAEGTYGFWHQTYQEYLAAAELAQRFVHPDMIIRQEAWNLAWEKRTYSRWSEILRLLVGVLIHKYKGEGMQQALSWLHALAAQRSLPEGDIGDFGLTLALLSMSEGDEMLVWWKKAPWARLEKDIASTWTNVFLEAATREHEARRERLLALAENISHFSPSIVSMVVQSIRRAVKDKSAHVRETALLALGKFGKHAPIDCIIEAFNDTNVEVRHAAAHAVAELGEHTPLKATIKALKNEKALVREAATQAVGEMKQPELMSYLIPGLDDENWRVRMATVKALGELGEQIPVDHLLKSLDDEVSLVRATAVEVLGKAEDNTPVMQLKAMLDDPDDFVRAAVIETLGERTPIGKLLDEIDIDPAYIPYSLTYGPALEVLSQVEAAFASDDASEGNERESQNPLAQTHTFSFEKFIPIIREFQQETPVEQLIEALYNLDKQRSLTAASILGRRQEWEIMEQFINSLTCTHGYLRALAIALLARLGKQIPATLFLSALTDNNAQARLAALNALENRDELLPPEASSVVTLLEDDNQNIRRSAMRILTLVPEHLTVDFPLLETLLKEQQNDDISIQRPASRCLERLKTRVTKDQIASLLAHEDASLRASAIKFFGKDVSASQLAHAIEDQNADVRAAAIQALVQRGRDVPPDLDLATLATKALRDEDISVAYAAIDLLRSLGEEEVLAGLADEDGFLDPPQRETPGQSKSIQEDISQWQSSSKRGKNDLFLLATYLANQQDRATTDDRDEISEMMSRIQAEAMREHLSTGQLCNALHAEKSEIRLGALQALGAQTPEKQLLVLLRDENWQIRKMALQIEGARVPLEQLLIALGDQHEEVREVALHVAKQVGERLPETTLITALEQNNRSMRASAIYLLAERAPAEKLIAALGDSEEKVRFAALDVLYQVYPEMMPDIISDLTEVVIGTGPSKILASAAKSFTDEIIGSLEDAPKFLLDEVTMLLDWPYWEVRVKAAQALGKLRRNIPEETINRLLALRKGSEVETIRRAADDALAEILSLEAGLEED